MFQFFNSIHIIYGILGNSEKNLPKSTWLFKVLVLKPRGTIIPKSKHWYLANFTNSGFSWTFYMESRIQRLRDLSLRIFRKKKSRFNFLNFLFCSTAQGLTDCQLSAGLWPPLMTLLKFASFFTDRSNYC